MVKVEVNGTTLYYETHGVSPAAALAPAAADGTLVVLHHGWTGDGSSWTQCAHALLARCPHLCVVLPDARGAGRHGSGEGSGDGEFTIAQLAADVVALVRVLQREAATAAVAKAVQAADVAGVTAPPEPCKRVVFVGLSMGGQVGVQVALTASELLHALVLVAPAKLDGIRGLPDSFHVAAAEARRGHLRSAARRADLLRQMVVLSPRAHDALVASRGAQPAFEATGSSALALEAALEAALRPHLETNLLASEAHFTRLWRAMTEYRPEAAHKDGLRAIATPTLMVAGAADDILMGNLEDFKTMRKTATLHVFSRVGHNIPRQVPSELAHVIADFLQHGVVTAFHLRQKLRMKGLL